LGRISKNKNGATAFIMAKKNPPLKEVVEDLRPPSSQRSIFNSVAGCADCKSLVVDEEIIPCNWPKTVKVMGGQGDGAKGGKKNAGAGKGKGKK
jgi:hypothetical protein